MKRANEIREKLNAAISSGDAKQMFDFAQQCNRALNHNPSATRANALRHAIDCVLEKIGRQWLVIEPQWTGTRKHMRLNYVLRSDHQSQTFLFGVFSAKKFAKKLNENKRAGSKTHAYIVNVGDYLAYATPAGAI